MKFKVVDLVKTVDPYPDVCGVVTEVVGAYIYVKLSGSQGLPGWKQDPSYYELDRPAMNEQKMKRLLGVSDET